MTSTFIASSAVSGAIRSSLMKLQTKLAEAQKEVATGRLADVGLSLGFKAGQTVSLRQEHSRLQSITDTNGLVASRLDASQAALKALAEGAQSFLGQLVAARNSDTAAATHRGTGQGGARRASPTSLNTTFNGASLFAGINADVKPITDYDVEPAGGQRSGGGERVCDGLRRLPVRPGGGQHLRRRHADLPRRAVCRPLRSGRLERHLVGRLRPERASSRISTSELIETSVNANDAAFRKLASAYTMLADLGTANLNQSAYQAVVDKATRAVGEAVQGITELQARLGTRPGAREERQRRACRSRSTS